MRASGFAGCLPVPPRATRARLAGISHESHPNGNGQLRHDPALATLAGELSVTREETARRKWSIAEKAVLIAEVEAEGGTVKLVRLATDWRRRGPLAGANGTAQRSGS